MPDEITITVNGRAIMASKGQLVIDAAEKHGVYIPRFCYHPRMHPVGMCRMCIVDIDTGRGPALQPACMIQVAPDMKVDWSHWDAIKRRGRQGAIDERTFAMLRGLEEKKFAPATAQPKEA